MPTGAVRRKPACFLQDQPETLDMVNVVQHWFDIASPALVTNTLGIRVSRDANDSFATGSPYNQSSMVFPLTDCRLRACRVPAL